MSDVLHLQQHYLLSVHSCHERQQGIDHHLYLEYGFRCGVISNVAYGPIVQTYGSTVTHIPSLRAAVNEYPEVSWTSNPI